MEKLIWEVFLTAWLVPLRKIETVSGALARYGQFPMIAALLAHNDTYVCTGTIVTMLHILTAAHCFSNVVPQNVAFGDISLYPGKNYSNSTRRISSIRSFVIHPDYQINSTYENDIAIVQIADPIVASDVTQLVDICDEVPEVDQDCLSVGWDTDFIKRKDNQSIFLVFHQATIQPADTCESNVKRSSNTLCTEKKSGEYLGHSEGALICNKLLCGVLTNYKEDDKRYSFYVKVSLFKTWIVRNTYPGSIRTLSSRKKSRCLSEIHFLFKCYFIIIFRVWFWFNK